MKIHHLASEANMNSSYKHLSDQIIVSDSREQLPLTRLFENFGLTVERAGLKTGDYSIQGHESQLAVERKSIPDLVQCMTGSNRTRFEKELKRSRELQRFLVVIEGPLADIQQHNYRSKVSPESVLGSLRAFEWRHRTRFIFCRDRQHAASCIAGLFDQYVNDVKRGKV